jgi:hypothetical protein
MKSTKPTTLILTLRIADCQSTKDDQFALRTSLQSYTKTVYTASV